uniref:Gla domain-containing protein n=1 Tax=Varanus komodoensis TaxID=61221 RepID=A0A8D2J381_VARKO
SLAPFHEASPNLHLNLPLWDSVSCSATQLEPLFLDDPTALRFLGRKPLYNRWDFELIVPDNLERECKEEVCNYEEAREVFEDDILTAEYGDRPWAGLEDGYLRVDVAGLVAGLVAPFHGSSLWVALTFLILLSVSLYRSQENLPHRLPLGISGEEPKPESAPGLPTYEQALVASGMHDAPPPPYERYSNC